MSGEARRGARWFTGAGTAMRRTSLPGVKTAARRESASVLQLRRPHEPPSGTGGTEARPYDRLEDETAVLRVVRATGADGRDGYRLNGWCGNLTIDCAAGPTRLPAPSIALANLNVAGAFPSELLRGIRHWSTNQTELANWLNRIRGRHGDALRLIVWDDTGYELPWELFWVPPDAEHALEGGLLGALLIMARWTTVHDSTYDLPRVRGRCQGRVLAYLHKDMVADSEVFESYAHHVHDEMDHFLRALDFPEDDTGLVYLGCHGTYGDVVMHLTLGNRTWAELDEKDMRVLRKDRSLVCLNACHSGRFVHNHGQGEEALRGFAELFLRKGAGGCIVAGGRIGNLEARRFVQQLMREVAGHPDHPVTHTLRDFRARAAADYGPLAIIPTTRNDGGQVDTLGQKRVLRLLYAFMLQYYGHPLTTLRLVAGKGQNAWGGGPW